MLIVGAGHNGLVTAAYLARAGKSVLILERRDIVGGSCVTEEPFPGFKFSTAAYSISLFEPSIVEDLSLRDFGLNYYPKDPGMFVPLPDGRHLILWHNMEAAQREIAKFSAADAEAYPGFEAFGDRATALLLSPPEDADRIMKRLTREDGLILEKVLRSSVAELLDEH